MSDPPPTRADHGTNPAAGKLEVLQADEIVVDVSADASHVSDRTRRRHASRDRVGQLIARLVRHAARTKHGRRLLLSILDDPRATSSILHRLSNRSTARASFSAGPSPEGDGIEGFEDCSWLFSSNPLNQGLARLELDEAAYLYRLVRSLDRPRTAEIGRFRGGTTFLLAAAGANVVSIDNDLARQSEFAPELAKALGRFQLRDRVEIVIADSRSYSVEEASLQLLFVDGDHSYEGVRADFEAWWPAVAPGGHVLFHDAVFPPEDSRRAVAEGVGRLVAELERDDIAQRMPAVGSLAHFVKSR